MTANYHTHTRWCRHGAGEIEQYAAFAVECGLEQLAITEHVPLPGDPDSNRMRYHEFAAYNAELDDVVARYRGRIRIIKGFECEYAPHLLELYREYRERWGYELLFLGQHGNIARTMDFFFPTREQLPVYAEEVCEGLATGMFAFLAHPDMVMYAYPQADAAVLAAMERIFSECARLHIPVEINGNGQSHGRGYPCRAVWELASHHALDCVVNSDAHQVSRLLAGVEGCRALAGELGLHVLERLPGYGPADGPLLD